MLEKLELIEVDEEDTSRLRLKFPPCLLYTSELFSQAEKMAKLRYQTYVRKSQED